MLRVGFGRAVITPPVPVMLAGFGDRTEPARSVHDDLEARAVALMSGDHAACLIVFDLLGMSAGFADPIREAVGKALGLPRAAVLTACTHTHAGPNAIEGGERLGWTTPERYGDLLVAAAREAAVTAAQAAVPARLHFGRASLPPDLSINRRELPYDPWFTVLDVRRADGARVGSIANVAIHPVALGAHCRSVSTDWVGPFRAALEAAGGGTTVLLSGALGDVNPRSSRHHDDRGDFGDAEELGSAVAGAVDDALTDAGPVSDGVDVLSSRTIRVPVGAVPLAQLLDIGDHIDVELVEWALGDVRLLSVPGEAFHAFARAVEAARGDRLVLAGLSPVWQGYLPVPFGVGYEEMVSFGEPAVRAILKALTEGPRP